MSEKRYFVQHRWYCPKNDTLIRIGNMLELSEAEKEKVAQDAKDEGLEVFTTKEGDKYLTVIGHSDETSRAY